MGKEERAQEKLLEEEIARLEKEEKNLRKLASEAFLKGIECEKKARKEKNPSKAQEYLQEMAGWNETGAAYEESANKIGREITELQQELLKKF